MTANTSTLKEKIEKMLHETGIEEITPEEVSSSFWNPDRIRGCFSMQIWFLTT